MCDVLDIAEQRGEARGIKLGEARGIKLGEERGAKTVIDLIRRLLNGEDESVIRKSGVNDEMLKMAVGYCKSGKLVRLAYYFTDIFFGMWQWIGGTDEHWQVFRYGSSRINPDVRVLVLGVQLTRGPSL